MGQATLLLSTQDIATSLMEQKGLSLEKTVETLRKDGHDIEDGKIGKETIYFLRKKWGEEFFYWPLVDQGEYTKDKKISEWQMQWLIDPDCRQEMDECNEKLHTVNMVYPYH